MSPLVVVLTLGLAARITRVLTVDRISYPIRQRIVVWLGPDNWFAYLVTCPWCLGLWVSAGVGAAAYFYADTRWWLCVALAGTASYVTGVLAQYTTGDNDA